MHSIGGYFGLELKEDNHFHSGSNCILLNTGRNCLEYILKVNKFDKIYLPYFTCDVMLEPILKMKIAYELYHVDENLEPIFNFDEVACNEVFLYTNYFGLKDDYVKSLSFLGGNLIIDNAQSFFSKPLGSINTFYSARKFMGVSDGAYLYTTKFSDELLENDHSSNRLSHLFTRLDKSAEEGYAEFVINDLSLVNQPILEMSEFSKSVLKSLDYEFIKQKRLENYNFLNENLNDINKLKVLKNATQIPMVYPFWTDDSCLREKLIKNRIYCAKYWPNVKLWNGSNLECEMTDNIIHLPIDQRYSLEDMKKIISYV